MKTLLKIMKALGLLGVGVAMLVGVLIAMGALHFVSGWLFGVGQ